MKSNLLQKDSSHFVSWCYHIGFHFVSVFDPILGSEYLRNVWIWNLKDLKIENYFLLHKAKHGMFCCSEEHELLDSLIIQQDLVFVF